MYKSTVDLNGTWSLYIAENKDCRSFRDSLTATADLNKCGFCMIPGKVPGNFELDMLSSGLIEDPFFGDNSLKIQELENRHLWYCRKFDFNGDAQNAYLIFEGIDTFADIYLNGSKIGHTDNMFIPHEIKAEGIIKGENELVVHILPAVIESRNKKFDLDVVAHQPYNAGSLMIRKAAHSFGWDIMPRIISGGLWRSVSLVEKKSDYIEELCLYTCRLSESCAKLAGYFHAEISGDFSNEYILKITGKCGDSSFSHTQRLWHNQQSFTVTVDSPLLWWPRDAGEQKLYDITAELIHNDTVCDTKKMKIGIRTVELERRDITDSDCGEFCFKINGEKIYIRGTNWVPLDAFHSRDAERLNRALELLYECNCNAVRCWGGNVYEDEAFFDFCDENGILVWQDFAMGCASYPQNEEFIAQLKEECRVIIKKLRHHASLAVWAGDNECDEFTVGTTAAYNPENNIITRKVLPDMLKLYDPQRPYLPSSPYYSDYYFKNQPNSKLTEIHLWGPRDYFKSDYYRNVDAHFISETGYHGSPSLESIKKFIDNEHLWPWQNNQQWLTHATCMEKGNNVLYSFRIALMNNQIRVLFGKDAQSIEEFIEASQLSQAEAMKTLVERFRCKKWNKTGVIWWNLIDGWPEFSDSVVDYYYKKKAAFSYLKRSQQPLCLMMFEADNNRLELCCSNDYLKDCDISCTVTDIATNRIVYSGNKRIPANSAITLSNIDYYDEDMHFFLIEWELNGKKFINHFLKFTPPVDIERYTEYLRACGLYDVS